MAHAQSLNREFTLGPLELGSATFSIEELETGLRTLGRRDGDLKDFWDQNIDAFRQTILFAIHETSEALLSPNIALQSRVELEGQLEMLAQYLKLAVQYSAQPPANPAGRTGVARRLH